MARTEVIRARIEADQKAEGEKILRDLGLSSSEAMRLFWGQLVRQRGLPFELRADAKSADGNASGTARGNADAA